MEWILDIRVAQNSSLEPLTTPGLNEKLLFTTGLASWSKEQRQLVTRPVFWLMLCNKGIELTAVDQQSLLLYNATLAQTTQCYK
jgi:hypothetical protein